MLTTISIDAGRSASIGASDPVLARMRYPFSQRFYPLGFPVDVVSNSTDVLDAAAESWADYAQIFSTVPIRIQVCVLEGGGSRECPPAPRCLVQQHLFSFVADQDNHGINDLQRGFSSIWATRAAVEHRGYFRYFFLECAAMSQLTTRVATGIHAACVARNSVGVLLCGESGAGKSTLSYACAKAGWTFVSDDGSYLAHDSDELLAVGNCHQLRFRPSAAALFPEIDGNPVTQRAETGKPSVELKTSALPSICYAQSASVRYLVFLNRNEGKNAPLRSYSKQRASEAFKQGRFTPPDLLQQQYEAIDRLLQAEVLELPYRDLAWAIEQLDRLVATGRS